MIKKDLVTSHLLMQAFGKETPPVENFEIQRYGSKKPSKLALLVLDLFNYISLRRVSAVITEGLEVWTIITTDDYAMTILVTDIKRSCSSVPKPNHKVIRKLKKFFEKYNFKYVGINTMPTPRFEFRADGIVFMLDKNKITKEV